MSSASQTDEDAPPPERSRGIELRADRPDGVFDADWYTTRYPDAAEGGLAPWEHFLAFGDAEHRAPGPDFDPAFYARTYQPLEGEHPAYHYIVYGRPRGYLTQPESFSRRESAQAMRAALLRRRHPIVLVGNDAQEAGAPILLLEIARHLAMRGFGAVFVLRRGGPLLDVFRSLGPTFIADEGWDPAGLGAAVRETTPILASTGWGAALLDDMGCAERGAVMVHEMSGYLHDERLIDAVGRAGTIIASMPAQRDALEAALPAHTGLRVIRPGLSTRAPRRRDRRGVARFLESLWGPDAVVFIGAGYADRRKGFDLFLEAARGIHSREPHARFIWLVQLSSWARRLADRAISDGLPLLLPGFRRDSPAWYAQARVYLLTSRQDPGPTTVMDAARAGVPFVAYDADIGLRSIDDQLTGVGEFVAHRTAFVDRALALAARDSDTDRRERSARIARLTPFGAYADQLVAALRDARPIEEPPRAQQWTGARTMWLRPIARRALQRGHSAFTSLTRTVGLPDPPPVHQRPVVGPWMHHTPPVRWGTSPIVLALSQSGPVPPEALVEAHEVAALQPGATTWLADAALLQHVPHPAVLHVRRDGFSAPWPIVAAIESATPTIVALHQYAEAPPQWLAQGDSPPRARWPHGGRRAAARTITLAPAAEPPNPGRIGVFLHAYYVDVAERLALPVSRIRHDAQLYISTDTPPKAERLRALFPDADVRVFANRGRDIYPKLFGWADVHAGHEIVLHLHTKRSPHSAHLSGWLDHILDRLVPSPEGVDAILALFAASPELGMVSPSPFDGIRSSYGWGSTLPLAQALTFDAGWTLPPDRTLEFPAGSMFWARSAALRPLQELEIPQDAFTEGMGMLDGTLAHAGERLLGVSCAQAGLAQVLLDPAGPGVRALTTAEAARHVRRLAPKR